ncbi:transcription elongation factor SPT6 isoform X2 [Bemisia tabaci]|uniref:transcription elongation factor SPT6 isoform X2 n=1 Tax=Bemisia tabaci TaxID=7038 RepID=UPI003B27E666
MADFIDSEAEESSDEEELDEVDRKRAKKLKQVDSDEEEEDDEEVLKDLIDDAPIEEDESDGEESDGSGSKKRKKSDQEDDYDDRLEDDDYDLLEENLGHKISRKKRFKRLRRIEDDESGDEKGREDEEKDGEDLYDSEREEERGSERGEDEDGEGDYSDADDFIVDDEGRPIASRKKKKPIFADAALQEAQDIFGVDFDFDEFDRYGDEYDEEEEEEEEEDDEYIDEEAGEDVDRPRKTRKKTARKATRKSIFELYEPIELKRGHFTDFDNEVRNTDIPERMQLREFPIVSVPEGSDELDDESEWIYKQAFCKPTISTQENPGGVDPRDKSRKGPQTIGKIKKALDFIRNQHFEVPFIAFYRKEYVQPELTINDLWRVYKFDAKWCQLKARKSALQKLFENMQEFQSQELMKESLDAPIPENVRLISDEDIDRLKAVQTTEELKDVHSHFLLHYSNEIPLMLEKERQKKKEAAKQKQQDRPKKKKMVTDDDGNEVEVEVTDDEAEPETQPEEEDEEPELVKPAVRQGPYSLCRKAGIGGFVKRFGLLPEQFAENLRDNYQRNEVEQEPVGPLVLAKEYTSSRFTSPEDVVLAAKYMLAMQISKEPLVKSCVRETFFERAKIDVRPTKKGMKEIDENHSCYAMKYLKGKPVRDLTGEQFMKLQIAEQDKLVNIIINEHIEGITHNSSYVEEVKQLFYRDEFSKHVQEWNKLRLEAVEIALSKMLFPDLCKELRTNLLGESKESVLKNCCDKLYNWLKVAPFSVDFDEDDEEWDTSKGLRIMSIAYEPDLSQAAFGCVISPEGEVIEHIRLPHLLKRKQSFRVDDKALKEADLRALREFISTKKPHAICVGGESREALMIVADVKEIITNLVEDEQFPMIPVEIVDNELSKIYANSNKGISDFREYPLLLRQAVSLARRLQDPLIEFSQLCTSDDEILCLRYHALQDQLSKEELLDALTIEFVNRTNEVGVDINETVQQVYASNLVQFVCGLGPRKAAALLKLLKQTNQRLENRTQLVTSCHMGPKVFINCAGFIKIDTNSLGDSTDSYVEVLDGSRVHPETYEWARKMAVDALEYEDDDANPAGALEEILEAPERLKDLDLDAFAEELERQGFGNKSITLYDIRAELNHRYKDLRTPYRSPNPEELFDILTKETPETFYIGKMISAVVSGISRKQPTPEQLDKANPIRNEETGLWQCPLCFKNDFPELSEVWYHFSTSKGCPGSATGVKIRLDNGVSGFIHIKNLSDKHVTDPEERVQRNQVIHCRIIKIDVERFSIDATSKSSDLLDKNHEWRPPKDPFYDLEAEMKDKKTEDDAKQQKKRQTYIKRVIVHPSFHNISYKEAEALMASMEPGEVIVRPSSQGADHLTVTWKVADGICQHIDVKEVGKENAFSLGQTLLIGNEEFEDLDEIIARHINPMAAYCRDIFSFRYYRNTDGGLKDKAEEIIKEERKKNPSKIHYIISVSKNYPGKFLLSYLPRTRCKHEYVTVTAEGYRYRGQMFDSISTLFRWFKEHFRDAIPGTPSTPRSVNMRSTPFQPHTPNMLNMSVDMQRVPPPMGLMHTPHYPQTPAAYAAAAMSAYPNTPYTPSAATPHFMTPYHTTQTPRYGGHQTPSHQSMGPFIHPAPVAPSPHRQPRNSQPSSSAAPDDWRKLAEDWVRSNKKDGSSTPRSNPRQSPRYEDSSFRLGRSTPSSRQMGPRSYPDLFSNKSPGGRSGYATPHSGRSTPRTVASPRSMIESSLGDATPLYDEN